MWHNVHRNQRFRGIGCRLLQGISVYEPCDATFHKTVTRIIYVQFILWCCQSVTSTGTGEWLKKMRKEASNHWIISRTFPAFSRTHYGKSQRISTAHLQSKIWSRTSRTRRSSDLTAVTSGETQEWGMSHSYIKYELLYITMMVKVTGRGIRWNPKTQYLTVTQNMNRVNCPDGADNGFSPKRWYTSQPDDRNVDRAGSELGRFTYVCRAFGR